MEQHKIHNIPSGGHMYFSGTDVLYREGLSRPEATDAAEEGEGKVKFPDHSQAQEETQWMSRQRRMTFEEQYNFRNMI